MRCHVPYLYEYAIARASKVERGDFESFRQSSNSMYRAHPLSGDVDQQPARKAGGHCVREESRGNYSPVHLGYTLTPRHDMGYTFRSEF